MKGAIIGFRRHLNSSKFHEDTTIQVSDVHNWLDIIDGIDEMSLTQEEQLGCFECEWYKNEKCEALICPV